MKWEFSYFPRMLWLLEWGWNGLKNFTKGLRDVKEGGIRTSKAGRMWRLTMKKSTLQVRLNGRVTFDRRIESPSLEFFFCSIKNKIIKKWLIKLANRVFGLSTNAFLKSVKKFLDKEVRTIRRPGSFPHHAPYFASAREDLFYKSLAFRNLCAIALLLLWLEQLAWYWAT